MTTKEIHKHIHELKKVMQQYCTDNKIEMKNIQWSWSLERMTQEHNIEIKFDIKDARNMANLRVGKIKFKCKKDKNKFLQALNDFNNRRKSTSKKLTACIKKQLTSDVYGSLS